MNKEQLRKTAGDPDYISGIYNYCDRWCDKCSFTSRCHNFAMTDMENLTPEQLDAQNREFWLKMEEIFSLTIEIIDDELEARHNDSDTSPDRLNNRKERRIIEKARDHAATKMAVDYREIGEKWFAALDTVLMKKQDDLNRKIDIGVDFDIVKEEVVNIYDAVEVIIFYLFFIQTKIIRALNSKFGHIAHEGEMIPQDSDGSAKIAMIAVERSVSAWGIMLKYFPEEEDTILGILVHLKRLHKTLLEEFPKAMKFVRPGFDE